MSLPDRPELRAGDDERRAVVDTLRVHFGAGRLTLDEFEERAECALAARTHRELSALLSDLPAVRTGPSGPPVRQTQPAVRDGWDVAFRIHVAVWLVLSAFFVILGIATGGTWPIFPIAGIGLSVGIHGAIKVAVRS